MVRRAVTDIVLDTLNNTRETLTEQGKFRTLQDRDIRLHLTVNQ